MKAGTHAACCGEVVDIIDRVDIVDPMRASPLASTIPTVSILYSM